MKSLKVRDILIATGPVSLMLPTLILLAWTAADRWQYHPRTQPLVQNHLQQALKKMSYFIRFRGSEEMSPLKVLDERRSV